MARCMRVYVPFCTAISDCNLQPLPINSQNQYRAEYLMGLTNKCVAETLCLAVESREWMQRSLNEAAFQSNNIQSQYSVYKMLMLFVFSSLLLLCRSLLTHSIADGETAPWHTRKWMRVRVSKHCTNANTELDRKISIEDWTHFDSCACSFVWLVGCSIVVISRSPEKWKNASYFSHLPVATASAVSLEYEPWLLCM